MRIMLSGCIVVLVVLAGLLAHAVEPLVLYDDFNATHIDPDKWVREEFGGADTRGILQLQDNRLHMFYRAYGKTDSDSGGLFNGLILGFSNSAAVTAIKATVQVNDIWATGCPTNPRTTVGSATLGGFFFNTDTETPGSAVNNVRALIGISRGSGSADPPDVLRAVSVVRHCADADCLVGPNLHFKDLGPVKRGEMARLRVQWDRDNHRFIFQRDDHPEVVARYMPLDTPPPGIRGKGLAIYDIVADCTATPRPVAVMEASFDDVFVNESAAPRSVR